MVLKKKISSQTSSHDIEEVISRGGHVSADNDGKKKKEKVPFYFFLEKGMLKDIDDAIKESGGLSNRALFIRQAIYEKLNRGE